MGNQYNLRVLIEIISKSSDEIEVETAFEHLYLRLKVNFRLLLRGLFYHYKVKPDSDISQTVATIATTEFYLYLRKNHFDHTRYKTEKELLSGLLSWWRQAAKWRLGNELKKLRRRRENIAFESELTEDYNDDGRKLDGVMQNWHETIGGVTAQEAAIYYRELKARIERLLPKMNKKYAAAIRHHFLNEHNPMKPTKEEKQQFMNEHCIKTDENYNKIKLLAKQQLRKLLDTDNNEE